MRRDIAIPPNAVEDYLKSVKCKCRVESIFRFVCNKIFPEIVDCNEWVNIHSQILVRVWELRDEGKVEETLTRRGYSYFKWVKETK